MNHKRKKLVAGYSGKGGEVGQWTRTQHLHNAIVLKRLQNKVTEDEEHVYSKCKGMSVASTIWHGRKQNKIKLFIQLSVYLDLA